MYSLLVTLATTSIDWYFYIIRGYDLVGYAYFCPMKPYVIKAKTIGDSDDPAHQLARSHLWATF